MHLNFDFTAVQIIWTVTFAAILVLLVVLLGRDRIRQFPWFTTLIVLEALRLLTSRLLFGRLAPLATSAIFIVMADMIALVGLLVVVELARKAFKGVPRRIWLPWMLGLLAVGAVVLVVWGPWPSWKTLTADSQIAALRLMQLVAQKIELLANVLAVELGMLVVLFGGDFKAGWRTHTQRVLIGLSVAAIGQMGAQGSWQLIAARSVAHSQAEYEHILGLHDKIVNGNGIVYAIVVVWWIVCLWIDEPGKSESGSGGPEAGEVVYDEIPADSQ
jgi:hypothetical protein